MTDPVRRARLHLDDVHTLPCGVVRLSLTVRDGNASFLSGQYLLLQHPDGTALPFSVASPPQWLPRLELHYLRQQGSDDARRMDELIATGGELEATFGHGRCGIVTPMTDPLIIVAGGTGITQARSILQGAVADGSAPVRLYWGARRAEDLYLAEEFQALTERHEQFRWQAVVEENPAAHPGAVAGRAADALARDLADGRLQLPRWTVLLAGGPPMVWGSIEVLRSAGLQREQTRSDVFEYAPRDDIWGDATETGG